MENKKDNLVISAYNQNFFTKKIDLLSSNQDKHTGILCYDKTDEELKNEIENFLASDRKVDIIRLVTTDLLKNIFNGFYVNGKKMMYMEYLSLTQFQTGIIDIYLNRLNNFEKLDSLEIELSRWTNATFSFIEDKSSESINKSSESLKTIFSLINQPSIIKKDKRICLIAQNKSNSPKKINILSTDYENGFEDKNIKVEVPIKDKGFLNTSQVRCFSENKEQLASSINLGEHKIETSVFWSPSQFQSIGVDMDLNLDVYFGGNFEITLLPYSKIMYIFYGE